MNHDSQGYQAFKSTSQRLINLNREHSSAAKERKKILTTQSKIRIQQVKYANRSPKGESEQASTRARERRSARWVLVIGVEKGGGGGGLGLYYVSYRRSHQKNEPQRDRPLTLYRNGVNLTKGERERVGRSQDGES